MDILQLLDAKGVDYVYKGAEISIVCPNQHQHHGARDDKPSFNINLEKEVGHCFACGFSLSQTGMSRWLLGEDLEEFQIKALEIGGALRRLQEQDKKPLTEETVPFFFPQGEPIDYDYRGIPAEFYTKLGGVVPKRGRYADRLCFPVMLNGELIGVDGRALNPGMEPRYLRNRGSTCGTNWLSFYDYNKQLIKETKSKSIILAEGLFHSIRPLSFGIPATCFFGAHNMSQDKVMLLLALGVEEVTYFPDLDDAGWDAKIEITQMLLPWFKVTWPDTSMIPLDEEASERKGKEVYKDLGDLDEQDISFALKNKVEVRMNDSRR